MWAAGVSGCFLATTPAGLIAGLGKLRSRGVACEPCRGHGASLRRRKVRVARAEFANFDDPGRLRAVDRGRLALARQHQYREGGVRWRTVVGADITVVASAPRPTVAQMAAGAIIEN